MKLNCFIEIINNSIVYCFLLNPFLKLYTFIELFQLITKKSMFYNKEGYINDYISLYPKPYIAY